MESQSHLQAQNNLQARGQARPKSFRAPVPLALVAMLAPCISLACNKPEGESSPQPANLDIAKNAQAAIPLASIAPTVDTLTLPKMPAMPIAKDNPQTPEKIELGRRLFFDKRLSVDGSRSCYSCHQDEQGSGGKDALAVGAKNKTLTRHSPVLWNVGHLPAFYWDGRSDSLESQALGAWGGGNMGVGKENLEKKAQELAALPDYAADFKKIFPGQKASAELVVKALSAFERTLECKNSAYDKYATGDKGALTQAQKVGLELFMGKGMCTACHSPPFFSSAYAGKGSYFNVGVGTKGVAEEQVDVGRMKVSEDAKDWAAFKVPSLRNSTRSAPYFHDGSVGTLREAVQFMAGGGHDNKNKTPLMSDKKLSGAEIDSIVTFLSALDCESTIQGSTK